jgi:hypothetical protein
VPYGNLIQFGTAIFCARIFLIPEVPPYFVEIAERPAVLLISTTALQKTKKITKFFLYHILRKIEKTLEEPTERTPSIFL